MNRNFFKKIFFVLLWLVLVYKITYRDGGTDYLSYTSRFIQIRKYGLDYFNYYSREPLFSAIGLFAKDKYMFFFLIGGTALLFKLGSILRYSLYPVLSLLFYYLSFFQSDELGRIRIGLATAIVLYNIKLLQRKKFVGVVLITSLIHQTTLLYLLPYMFRKIKLKKKTYWLILVLSILIGNINLMKYFDYILILAQRIPGFRAVTAIYIGSNLEKVGLSLIMLPKIFFISMLLYNKDKLERYQYFKNLFTVYYIGILIYFGFNSIRSIATRGSEVLLCCEFLLLPYLIKVGKNQYEKIFIILLLVGYYLYIFI